VVFLVKPTLEILLPENKTYISNKNLPLNFTVENQDAVWYNLDSGANTTITGNTTFNVSGGDGQHTLYLFANNTLGETVENIVFTVNQTVHIHYENYNQGETTKFNTTSYEDLQNLSEVIIENPLSGKIRFNEAINLTDVPSSEDHIHIDINSHINISDNLIEINSSALPNFNKSATLSLYGLTFSNPRVLRNGVACPSEICTEVSYSGGIFVFTVTGFTNYSADETPVEAVEEPSGTDTTRGGGTPECVDNSQCAPDEVCWNYACAKLFDIKITDFSSPIKLGEFFNFTYYVKGVADINADVVIDFWIQDSKGEIITSGSDVIYLGSFEEKTETTKIFLPTGFRSGVYRFYVKVTHPSYSAESYRTIEVEVQDGVVDIRGIDIGAGPEGNTIIIIIIILLILALGSGGAIRSRGRKKTEQEPETEPISVKSGTKTKLKLPSTDILSGLLGAASTLNEAFKPHHLRVYKERPVTKQKPAGHELKKSIQRHEIKVPEKRTEEEFNKRIEESLSKGPSQAEKPEPRPIEPSKEPSEKDFQKDQNQKSMDELFDIIDKLGKQSEDKP
jgi:hypothetical protein